MWQIYFCHIFLINYLKILTQKMILFLTTQISPSSDGMMHIFAERKIPVFRLNMDMFNSYNFLWDHEHFEIINPSGLICNSAEVSCVICYHARMTVDQHFQNIDLYGGENKWVVSWLNHLHDCFVAFGNDSKILRLFAPVGMFYSKTLQMNRALKYFAVPNYYLHFGRKLAKNSVIVKSLTQRPFSDGSTMYAKIIDQADLDSKWPWFTQDIADGNRDATVLYINGKVHCYQFATERGNLTDWRITQGTEANQWIPWDAGKEFEGKIDLYMKDIGLKFGRLDFIIGGKEPQFLEVNPVGQFGWLDDENLTLHNEVVDAILDPSSTITL